jgi:hypothetical protein
MIFTLRPNPTPGVYATLVNRFRFTRTGVTPAYKKSSWNFYYGGDFSIWQDGIWFPVELCTARPNGIGVCHEI